MKTFPIPVTIVLLLLLLHFVKFLKQLPPTNYACFLNLTVCWMTINMDFTGDLPVISSSWSATNNNRGENHLVSLDASKTSDRVWHESLLYRMSSFEFYPDLASWISPKPTSPEPMGFCFIRSLWMLIIPKVPYLNIPSFVYLLMILHVPSSYFTVLPTIQLSISLPLTRLLLKLLAILIKIVVDSVHRRPPI